MGAHQKTKAPNFRCKNDEKCTITVKTRRKCQLCRYKICVKLGMRPEAVLTDDQKKIRFRNSLQKKSETGENHGNFSDRHLTIESDDEENPCARCGVERVSGSGGN